MIKKEVIIYNNNNNKGIQARIASSLVRKAMVFKSNINLTYDNKTADAKSLINVLALKVPKGATLIITATGDDEVLAIHELVKYLGDLG